MAPNAAWCSLCYADLRHPAEPAKEEAPSYAAVAAAARQEIPVAPTAAAAMRATVVAATADVLDAATPLPGVVSDEAGSEKPPTWPCPRCGARVAMALDACNECGTGFLSGATAGMSMKLPMVGDVSKLSSSQRLVFGLAVAVAVTLLLVLIGEIGGHII